MCHDSEALHAALPYAVVDVGVISIVAVAAAVVVWGGLVHGGIELSDDVGEHAQAHLLLGGGRAVGDHDHDVFGGVAQLGDDDDRALASILHGEVVGGEEERIAPGFGLELIRR